MKPFIKFIAGLALVLLHPAFSLAAGEPPLTTDRPSQSDASTLVPQGYFQVEAGYTFAKDDSAGVETRSHSLPNLFLRYGVWERVELRLGWDGYLSANPDPGDVQEGVGDGQVSAKVYLWEQSDLYPETTLLAGATIPWGANAVSSNRSDPFFRFLMTYALSGDFSLGSNLGLTWKTQSTGSGGRDTEADFIYTVLLGYAVSSEVDGFVEFFGAQPLENGPDRHGFDAGVAWRILPTVQVDVFGGVGLNDAAVDAFVSTGVSFRLP